MLRVPGAILTGGCRGGAPLCWCTLFSLVLVSHQWIMDKCSPGQIIICKSLFSKMTFENIGGQEQIAHYKKMSVSHKVFNIVQTLYQNDVTFSR